MRGKHRNNSVKAYRYDPVCRLRINKHKAYYVYRFGKEQFLLCCPECQAQFENNRQNFMEEARTLDAKTNRRRA